MGRTRLAYAARQLLQQVDGEPVGDPDGLGVIRTVMITTTADLEAIEADARVTQVDVVDTDLGPVALVRFRTDRLGDVIGNFNLD